VVVVVVVVVVDVVVDAVVAWLLLLHPALKMQVAPTATADVRWRIVFNPLPAATPTDERQAMAAQLLSLETYV
jgi:hypothetical protein